MSVTAALVNVTAPRDGKLDTAASCVVPWTGINPRPGPYVLSRAWT